MSEFGSGAWTCMCEKRREGDAGAPRRQFPILGVCCWAGFAIRAQNPPSHQPSVYPPIQIACWEGIWNSLLGGDLESPPNLRGFVTRKPRLRTQHYAPMKLAALLPPVVCRSPVTVLQTRKEASGITNPGRTGISRHTTKQLSTCNFQPIDYAPRLFT